jgi:hypothetical protein
MSNPRDLNREKISFVFVVRKKRALIALSMAEKTHADKNY